VTDKSDQDSSQESVPPNPFADIGSMYEKWTSLMSESPLSSQMFPMAVPGLDDANSSTREAFLMMTELYRLAMMHGFQYQYRIAAKNMHFYPIVADKMAKMNSEDENTEARGEYLESLKMWMREITDVSHQESRKFLQEFETLVDDIWLAGLSTDDERAGYHRRHKTKQ